MDRLPTRRHIGLSLVASLLLLGTGCAMFRTQTDDTNRNSDHLIPMSEAGASVVLISSTEEKVPAPVWPEPANEMEDAARLRHAALRGSRAKMNAALDAGAQIDAPDALGNTALHWAVVARRPGTLELLLSRGASVDARNDRGLTALRRAVEDGQVDIVRLLLSSGADINAPYRSGYTALHWAAIKGRLDVAELLIDYGAAMNAQNRGGLTPLRCAVMQGHAKVAELLRSRSATE